MDKRWLIAVILVGILAGAGLYIYGMMKPTFGRSARVVDWIKDPAAHPDWAVRAGTRCLPDTPFIVPTDG